MRIHANYLTVAQLCDAARAADVDFLKFKHHRSNSRDHAFEVQLTGSGRRVNSGTRGAGAHASATWDEWGIFLAALFAADVTVTIPRVYDDGADFDWATDGRFDGLAPAEQHKRHRWVYDYVESRGLSGEAVHYCSGKDCSAVKRYRTR